MSSRVPSTLEAFARRGMLGLAVPAAPGGSGGDLADLFDAVAEVARTSIAAARILAVQRHFAQVLLSSQNVAVAEYRLASILDGSISGACSATWPEQPLAPLQARKVGTGWRLGGSLHAVPNVGKAWYLVTALVQPFDERPPHLVLLSSEQDGLVREAVASSEDDSASLCAAGVFFRDDEILQEDAAQIGDGLARFAAFLRCAIEAGRARGAVDGMGARLAAEGRATLARTVNALVRPGRDARGLPGVEELRAAVGSLRLLHAAASH